MKNYFAVILITIFGVSIFGQNAIDDALKNYTVEKIETISTKDNLKKQGINLSIKIPTNYIQKEGLRPHILCNFNFPMDYDKGTLTISIQINEIPLELLKLNDQDLASIMFSDEMTSQRFQNQEILLDKATKYDGQDGRITITYIKTSRAGLTIYALYCVHTFIYNRKTVSINCMYGVNDELTKNIEIKKYFAKFKVLNTFLGNSIVIDSKWDKY